MGTTDNYVSIMIDGLKKKVLILNQIIGFNHKEKQLLQNEPFDMDDFDVNMKEKAAVLDQLIFLDDGFTAVFNRVKLELDNNKHQYEEQIKQMKILISKVTELSVKIQSEEARNKELAHKQFSSIKKEVKLANRSERMASQYYKAMNMVDSEPQFLDKKK
ncbi:PDDEXK family nuclease [[Clostridium] fimetarium]|uniref:FlgN protein n=1 Tax=[Clostridium] fimetarium TaxID=99656 RepID=A0A1I0P446_9FIRM|nr:flagellar export chaperone FlgN [[Clostridium] fimetarium]SEW08971.1 FlgN protein [[Clostridium] fimetarium]